MNVKFLFESAGNIAEVYAPYVTDRISAIAKLDATPYKKSDILSAHAEFAETEFLFSTWGMPQFSAEVIRTYLSKLKCVFYAAGTVQAFARPFLECGVKVFSAWAANAVPVAEYAVSQIILANKGFFAQTRLMAEKRLEDAQTLRNACIGNYREKIGLIGCGMIGSLVAEMLKAYELEVLAFDPFLSAEKAAALGVKTDGLKVHGFPRLTANIGILIAHGRRLDLLPIFREMMGFCCKTIPRVKAANDFSVQEIVACIREIENAKILPQEEIGAWKADLATIEPTTCYTRFALSPDDDLRNWALFTGVSEYFRLRAGIGGSMDFIEMQIAIQLP